jgi:hypothetical protein
MNGRASFRFASFRETLGLREELKAVSCYLP